MRNKLFVCATTAALAGLMFGCSGAPTTTTQAPIDEMQAPSAPTYSVQAVGPQINFDQVISQLPKQISVADAQRMLVTVDPSIVKDEPNSYSVQQLRGRGGFGGFGRGIGFRGAFGRPGGFHGYGNYRFFRHNNYYFPYYRRFGYYYPYYYNNYYPYLYSYNNYCYPYTYNRYWY